MSVLRNNDPLQLTDGALLAATAGADLWGGGVLRHCLLPPRRHRTTSTVGPS